MIWPYNKAGEKFCRHCDSIHILIGDSVIYKLFFRAFPNHFKSNSVYAHYPMTIPRQDPLVAVANLGFFSTDSS